MKVDLRYRCNNFVPFGEVTILSQAQQRRIASAGLPAAPHANACVAYNTTLDTARADFMVVYGEECAMQELRSSGLYMSSFSPWSA